MLIYKFLLATLKTVTLGLLLLALCPSPVAAKSSNILFISTDDHSYRTLSCDEHAESWARTPKIDRLARRGIRFTHACIGTWCMPLRVIMLTDLHQYGARTMRMEGESPGSEYDPAQCPFWPAVFRKHGYHTAHIGKWHSDRDSGFGRDRDHQIVGNRPMYIANTPNYSTPASAIRQGDWKLIEFYETGECELYDLSRDLAEQHDLAATQPDRVQTMKTALGHLRKQVAARMPEPNPRYDPQLATELGKSSDGKRKGDNE